MIHTWMDMRLVWIGRIKNADGEDDGYAHGFVS